MILRMSGALNLPTPQNLLRAKWSSSNPLIWHSEQGCLGFVLGTFGMYWGLELDLCGSGLVALTPTLVGEKSRS